MDKLHQPADARVKKMTLDKGFLHIDLFDGMRLTGPAKRPAGGATKTGMVETGPGSSWAPDHNLDDLFGDPA